MTQKRLLRIQQQVARIKQELLQIDEMRPGSLTRQYKNPKEKTGGFYQISYTYNLNLADKRENHLGYPRYNARVEQCPGGASVSNSWFSRSGAEGDSGVRCSTRAFSLRAAEGER